VIAVGEAQIRHGEIDRLGSLYARQPITGNLFRRSVRLPKTIDREIGDKAEKKSYDTENQQQT
jgi:hypothetical protein